MKNLVQFILYAFIFSLISCKKDITEPSDKSKTCYTSNVSFDNPFPIIDSLVYNDKMLIDSIITYSRNNIDRIRKFYYAADGKLNRTEDKMSESRLVSLYEYNNDNTLKSIRTTLYGEDSLEITSEDKFIYNTFGQIVERRHWSEDYFGDFVESAKTIYFWDGKGNNIRSEYYSKQDSEYILKIIEEYEFDSKPKKPFANGFAYSIENKNNMVKVIFKNKSGNITDTQLQEHTYNEADYITHTKITFNHPDNTSFLNIKYDYTCK